MDNARNLVVLIHGWFSSSWLMMPLANRIGSVGFETRIWGYPSLRKDIQTHASRFGRILKLLAKENPQRDIRLLLTAWDQLSPGKPCWISNGLPSSVWFCLGLQIEDRTLRHTVTRVLGGRCRTLDQIADRADSFVNRLPDPPLDEAREAAWPRLGSFEPPVIASYVLRLHS